jgi:hypothetical protein
MQAQHQASLKTFAYTGLQSSRDMNFRAEILSGSKVQFNTTRKLKAKEGLTIGVQWPKGFVHEPTFEEKMSYVITDNKSGIVLVGGAILLFLFISLLYSCVGICW